MTQPPQYPSYPGDEPQQPAGGYPPPGYQPPPPGYQPPPPGYQPPPPGYQYPPQGPVLPPGVELAGWWSRVGAYLIDSLLVTLIIVIPVVAGAFIAFADAETDPITDEITGGVEPLGIVLMVLGFLIGLAFHIWNRGIRLGSRGQSLGKQLVGQRVVGVNTGQPIGAGMGTLRWLLDYILSNACFLNWLWPLWDGRKQTWHDMIVKSVVIKS